jgi:hypothetical protein
LPENLLKLVLQHVLLALDFLHSEAKVIHTGEFSSRCRTLNKLIPSRYSREEHSPRPWRRLRTGSFRKRNTNEPQCSKSRRRPDRLCV